MERLSLLLAFIAFFSTSIAQADDCELLKQWREAVITGANPEHVFSTDPTHPVPPLAELIAQNKHVILKQEFIREGSSGEISTCTKILNEGDSQTPFVIEQRGNITADGKLLGKTNINLRGFESDDCMSIPAPENQAINQPNSKTIANTLKALHLKSLKEKLALLQSAKVQTSSKNEKSVLEAVPNMEEILKKMYATQECPSDISAYKKLAQLSQNLMTQKKHEAFKPSVLGTGMGSSKTIYCGYNNPAQAVSKGDLYAKDDQNFTVHIPKEKPYPYYKDKYDDYSAASNEPGVFAYLDKKGSTVQAIENRKVADLSLIPVAPGVYLASNHHGVETRAANFCFTPKFFKKRDPNVFWTQKGKQEAIEKLEKQIRDEK